MQNVYLFILLARRNFAGLIHEKVVSNNLVLRFTMSSVLMIIIMVPYTFFLAIKILLKIFARNASKSSFDGIKLYPWHSTSNFLLARHRDRLQLAGICLVFNMQLGFCYLSKIFHIYVLPEGTFAKDSNLLLFLFHVIYACI